MTDPATPTRPRQPWTTMLDGRQLRRLRRQHGLSQEQLAAHAGISLTTIRRLEHQPAAPCRSRTLGRLARALGEHPACLNPPHPEPPGTQPRHPSDQAVKDSVKEAITNGPAHWPHGGRQADQSCTRPSPQPPQRSLLPRRSDAGTVRVSGRDIDGLMLCGEMYGAPYDLLAALPERPAGPAARHRSPVAGRRIRRDRPARTGAGVVLADPPRPGRRGPAVRGRAAVARTAGPPARGPGRPPGAGIQPRRASWASRGGARNAGSAPRSADMSGAATCPTPKPAGPRFPAAAIRGNDGPSRSS